MKNNYNINALLKELKEEESLLLDPDTNIPWLILGTYVKEDLPFFYMNDKMRDSLGYSCLEEFIEEHKNSVADAIHPEQQNHIYEEIKHQLEEKGEFDISFRMRKKDGAYWWYKGQGKSYCLKNGDSVLIGYYMDITNLKEQEIQLMLYRRASLGGAFLVRLDDDFTLLYGNDIYYQVHEYTPESMRERIGNRCREYVYPEDLPHVRSVIAKALEGGKSSVEWEMRIITGKGKIRWILASAAFEHRDGEILVNGFVIDNTERHVLKEEAERRDKWYQLAVSQTTMNVWEYDLSSHCILLNNSSERQHGYQNKVENVPESLIECEYIHPDSWKDFRDIYYQLHAGQHRVQADIKTRTLDGKDWWWERITYELEYDESGNPYRAVAVGEDITKEKEAELKYEMEAKKRLELSREVHYREQLLDALAFNVDSIYMLFEKNMFDCLQYVSPNLERLLGISSSKLIENPNYLTTCIPKKADYHKWQKILKEKGKSSPSHYEICFQNAVTQKMLWMEVEVRELNVNDTNGLLLILNNRTEEKNHEKQLATALSAAEYANKAKSFFLSNMSHDIRTPMNAIIGMTEIALTHLNEPDKMKDCLNKISVSSQYLLGLINDVLDMSKIESGKMALKNERLSLPEFIENVVAIMQPVVESKDQQFSLQMRQSKYEYFYFDSLRFRQILLNIISNASKFTPVGGKITLVVDATDQFDANNVLLQIHLSDTGIGMKPEFLTSIFDPFVREQDSRVDKIEGSGLGLAITKKIVDMLGGKIKVQSQLGKGTCFFISFPLQIADVEAEEGIALKKKPWNADQETKDSFDYTGKRFLLVEDNELNREIAIELLSATGAKIDFAYDGLQGVNKFEESPIGYYDLILMDIQMPVMNGYVATRKIRTLSRIDATTIPICAMTADAFLEDIEMAKKAGMNAHFAKPLDIRTVNREIGALLKKNKNTV